jgi:hypothetical protein
MRTVTGFTFHPHLSAFRTTLMAMAMATGSTKRNCVRARLDYDFERNDDFIIADRTLMIYIRKCFVSVRLVVVHHRARRSVLGLQPVTQLQKAWGFCTSSLTSTQKF